MSDRPARAESRTGLEFAHVPPLSIPLRYFLTAPLFALGAAVVLLTAGAPALGARAFPVTLALTHLVTLGVLAMIAIGALFQILPVIGAVVMPATRPAAKAVHALLSAGTIALAAGFLHPRPWLPVAAALLGIGFLVFLGVVTAAFARSRVHNWSMRTLRLAALALGVAIACGIAAALARSGHALPGVPAAIGTAHVAIALGGWFGLLLAGAAYVVVPMFQSTPPYPAWVQRGFVSVVATALLGALARAFDLLSEPFRPLVEGLLAAPFVVFAVTTMALQRRRRRRIRDMTGMYWQFGMSCLLAAVIALPVLRWYGADPGAGAAVAVGILVLIGTIQSVMNGMLYKIIPFLAWLHLKRRGIRGAHMHDFIAARALTWQLRLHGVATVLLVLACALPGLTRFAAAAYLAANLALAVNLAGALQRYRQFSR